MTEFLKQLPPEVGVGFAVAGFLFGLFVYFRPKKERFDVEFRRRAEETKRVAADAARQVELLKTDHVGRVDLHRAANHANDRFADLFKRVAVIERDLVGFDRRLLEISEGIRRIEGQFSDGIDRLTGKFERWIERHDDREQRGDRGG